MDRARIALVFVVLLFAVCAAQSKEAEKWTDFRSWAALRRDMTESQVINLLGQPKETTTSQTDSTNIWYYQQIPLEQTYKLCDGCVVFKKNSAGTYILYRWKDPDWQQVEADKKEKETALETAAKEAELERQAEVARKELEQAELAQKELEQAEKAKETPEPKSQSPEEARRMKAKMIARFMAMEKEQKEEEEGEEERAASSDSAISDIAAERHFVLIGTILLAAVCAMVLTLKFATGRFWWKHKKTKEKKSSDFS
jgi:outer membrane protein assembly factor BamE (lipoprotein component of BamABCDE complex)